MSLLLGPLLVESLVEFNQLYHANPPVNHFAVPIYIVEGGSLGISVGLPSDDGLRQIVRDK